MNSCSNSPQTLKKKTHDLYSSDTELSHCTDSVLRNWKSRNKCLNHSAVIFSGRTELAGQTNEIFITCAAFNDFLTCVFFSLFRVRNWQKRPGLEIETTHKYYSKRIMLSSENPFCRSILTDRITKRTGYSTHAFTVSIRGSIYTSRDGCNGSHTNHVTSKSSRNAAIRFV